jgi:hypothetical protein
MSTGRDLRGMEHPAVEAVARRLDVLLLQGDLPEPDRRRVSRHRRELVWIEAVLFNGGHWTEVPASHERPGGRVEALAIFHGGGYRFGSAAIPLVMVVSGLLATINEYAAGLEQGASTDV